MMLDRLMNGHRQLEAIAARLVVLLADDRPDEVALKSVRWEFATKLMQHLALEDRHVYASLAASDDPRTAAIGRRYQTDYARHLADYAEHARHWTNERVVARWAEYRAATRTQLLLLQARIDLVERELYPLFDTHAELGQQGVSSRSWARDAFEIKTSVAPAVNG